MKINILFTFWESLFCNKISVDEKIPLMYLTNLKDFAQPGLQVPNLGTFFYE
jgi:hypothetical protein